VPHREQKRRAEDLIESVPGVRDVSNHIKVRKHEHEHERDRDRLHERDRDRDRWTAAGTTGTSMTGTSPRFGSAATGALGTGAAATGDTAANFQGQIRTGMEVCDLEGNRLGEVKEMRGSEFLLDRPMRRDVYVPFDAVQDVRGDRITLRYRESEIGDLNWEQPALMGGGNKGER